MKLKNKILIASDTYPSQINGVVTTINATINELKKRNYEIFLLDSSLFHTISSFKYPQVKLAYNFFKVFKLIKQFNPDFIHIATEGPIGLFTKLYCDYHHYKYSTSYHTQFPEFFYDYYHINPEFTYKLIHWFHKKASFCMVNSNDMINRLYEHNFTNLSKWSRGVDTTIFNPYGNIPDLYKFIKKPILLNVGRISIEKNLPAFYNYKGPGTKIQIGEGPQKEEYKETYKDVIFVNTQKGHELADYYRGADAFIFPSYRDTFGLVMIESMACGTPVAAFNVTGPKDVITNKISGLFSNDLYNIIPDVIKMKKRPDNINIMTKEILKYSWESCTNDFINHLVTIK